jgi:hypothetical protein
MADETNVIELEFKGAKTLKQELREANELLQKMVASGKATEAQIQAQTARVAELKDTIDDTNDSVGALTGAGKFAAFGKSISAVAGGFTALSGAVALAGGESEDLQKTMVKLQAALSISQGLSQLEDLGNAFGNIKKVAGSAFDTVKNVGSKAFGSLKSAIISTGIGALVVALGLLIANFETVKKVILNAIPGLETFGKWMSKITTAVTDFVGITSAEERQLKKTMDARQGAIDKLDLEIQKAKAAGDSKKALNLEEKKLLQQLQLAREKYTQDASKENAKEIKDLKGALEVKKIEIKKYDDDQAQKDKERRDELRRKNQEEDERLKKEREAKDKEENSKQDEQLKKQKEYQDQLTLLEIEGENERTKKALELKQLRQREDLDAQIKAYEDRKATLTEEEKQTLESLQKTRTDLIKFQAKETAALNKDIDDKEAKDKLDRDLANQEKLAAEKRTALANEYTQGLIDKKAYDQKIYDLEVASLQEQIAIQKAAGQDTAKIEEELANLRKEKRDQDVEATKQSEEEKKKARQESLQAGLEFAGNVAGQLIDLEKSRVEAQLSNQKLSEEEREKIAKDSFEKQKKLQIALALIDAAKTTTSILAQYPKFDGGIAMFAALATTAVTLGVSIAKIKSTEYTSPKGGGGASKPAGSKFEEGGLVTGPGHGLGGVKTAMGELEGGEFVVNRIAAQQFLPFLEKINTLGDSAGERMMNPQPTPIVKTYVLASDVSSAQEADKRIADIARL